MCLKIYQSPKYTFLGLLPSVKKIIIIKLNPPFLQMQLILIHISIVPSKNGLIMPLWEPVPFSVHHWNFMQSKIVIYFIIEEADLSQIALDENVHHVAKFTILLSLLLFNSLTIPALAAAVCSGKYHCPQWQTVVLRQAKYHSELFSEPQALATKGVGKAHTGQMHWHLRVECWHEFGFIYELECSLASIDWNTLTIILQFWKWFWWFCCCCEFNPEICSSRQKGKEKPYNILVRKSFLLERKITSFHIMYQQTSSKWLPEDLYHCSQNTCLEKYHVQYPSPLSHTKLFLSREERITCSWKYSLYIKVLEFAVCFVFFLLTELLLYSHHFQCLPIFFRSPFKSPMWFTAWQMTCCL